MDIKFLTKTKSGPENGLKKFPLRFSVRMKVLDLIVLLECYRPAEALRNKREQNTFMHASRNVRAHTHTHLASEDTRAYKHTQGQGSE